MARMSARIIKAALELKEVIQGEKQAADDIVRLQARLDKYTSPLNGNAPPPSDRIRWRIHFDYHGSPIRY